MIKRWVFSLLLLIATPIMLVASAHDGAKSGQVFPVTAFESLDEVAPAPVPDALARPPEALQTDAPYAIANDDNLDHYTDKTKRLYVERSYSGYYARWL